MHVNSLRTPVLQSAEFDDNRDGLTDRMELSVQMPLGGDEVVTGMTAMLMQRVSFSAKARYVFDAAAYINYESATPISQLTVDGDLVLRQTWPLTAKGGSGLMSACIDLQLTYIVQISRSLPL